MEAVKIQNQAITVAELEAILASRKGATIATIVAETEPTMKKTNNPFVGATKISRVNGMINWHYENAVNKQREKEGHEEVFFSAPRQWGERIKREDGTLTPLVRHKGKAYLELKVQNSLGYEYRHNGAVVPAEMINPFLPQKKEGARQEVEKIIVLRDYALENIRQIVLDGQTIDIV
jgi:hypothetical protein